MFRVGRMFKSLLQMHKGSGGLDQSLEEICVARISFQPKLLEDIVSLVIALFVPATEKRLIKWMLCHIGPARVHLSAGQLGHEPRNPLAFAHERLNLLAAHTMGKRPAKKLFEERRHERSSCDSTTVRVAVLR